MAVSRLPWSTMGTAPQTWGGTNAVVIPVVLVAGVPRVLVPAGWEGVLTSTVVTSGSVDPAWWPGVGALAQTLHDGPVDTVTFDPVRGWLDPGVQWQTYEQARPLEGDVNVEALTFTVFDAPQPGEHTPGAATAELSAPLARRVSPTVGYIRKALVGRGFAVV